MYTILRKTHLYAGLVVLLFVLMYFVTGYLIIHADWFSPTEPTVVEQEAALNAPADMDAEALSRYVQHHLDLPGKRLPPTRLKDGGWRFQYQRPGTVYRVEVTADRNRAHITRETMGWQWTLNRLHHLHGYGGGALYTLWGILLDLVGLSMIVFAVTGIYLWYKLTRKRRLGWILLALSWAFTLGTMGYLWFAP